MVFQDEPFFGQDRIDLLAWRLGQEGLGRAQRRALGETLGQWTLRDERALARGRRLALG